MGIYISGEKHFMLFQNICLFSELLIQSHCSIEASPIASVYGMDFKHLCME